jgi:hypothetical protein
VTQRLRGTDTIWNIGNFHWVLDIAVNPVCMLSIVTSAQTDESRRNYGFMHVDPLESQFWDSTIPASAKFLKDSQLHVRSLVFLLNYMSRYRNLFIHDLIDEYVPLHTIEYIWVMRAARPFGCIFAENDTESAPLLWQHYSWSYFPQLKTQPKTLPVQCDGYNCGIYVLLNSVK